MRRLAHLVLLAAPVGACSALAPEPLAPNGEVLVVVDTDLPVPRVVSRLRVDVMTEDGRWIASRDDVRADVRDWPTSFSVYTDDPSRQRVLLVRLRAYPDARVVPYRGDARLEGGPTPDSEPDPGVAVDRTVRVQLSFGARGRVRVMLRGECAGVGRCSDGEPPLEPTMERALPTAAGTFALAPCEGVPTAIDRVCVPGGAFVFGDAFHRPPSTSSADRPIDARPERVVALSRFLMDRSEVSVGRFRDAIARGFAPKTPVGATERDGAPGGVPSAACTWSASPRGREGYPLSCVTWDTARAFCAFEGGDLPTEAQWEYAALAAGRTAKATYPWGEDAPTCARAVYGRALARDECTSASVGLPPPTETTSDVSAVGIRDLAGSLEEHVLDDHAPFAAGCWASAPRVDPTCVIPPPPECVPDVEAPACRFGPGIVKSVRGGSWLSRALDLRVVARERSQPLSKTSDSVVGFRCVYPAP